MSELRRAFDPVADILEALHIDYRIGGSVASAALGVSRSTLDIDIVVRLLDAHVDRLVAHLSGDYYVDAESIREAIRRRRSFNLIHFATMIKIDVFVIGDGEYDREEMQRMTPGPIADAPDRLFPLATAEDIVLRKLQWYERADRVSERQWSDVLGVLRIQSDALDLTYLRHWAGELGLMDLLEQALSEAAPESGA